MDLINTFKNTNVRTYLYYEGIKIDITMIYCLSIIAQDIYFHSLGCHNFGNVYFY